jgi:hypothetical protein
MFGTFVTALDGPGFSVTLLGLDDELLPLLDAPTTAPGWPKRISTATTEVVIANEEKSKMMWCRSHQQCRKVGKPRFSSLYYTNTHLQREEVKGLSKEPWNPKKPILLNLIIPQL